MPAVNGHLWFSATSHSSDRDQGNLRWYCAVSDRADALRGRGRRTAVGVAFLYLARLAVPVVSRA